MIRPAITVCLVEQARTGPFVFHGDPAAGCRAAAEAGFDAIELFAPSAAAIRALPLQRLLSDFRLELAAVGTGAGMIIHQLSLTDADSSRRQAAKDFIREVMDAGAGFGAPAIIGSMQGRRDAAVPRELATAWLQDALQELGEHAKRRGTTLLYEPLNRYETNIANTLAAGLTLLEPLSGVPVRLLADLFHMNIEEADLAAALIAAGPRIGHLHFADSNRLAPGFGHTDFAPIVAALASTGFDGYASAEVFPVPDAMTCARQTMHSFVRYFRS